MILPLIVVAAGIAILSHIAPFPFLLDALHRGKTVWRMPDRAIYLTFDDGPNPTATPQLLDLLKEKRVRATFFLIDDYVNEETAPIVRRMFEEGHAVALHTGRRWLLIKTPGSFQTHLSDAARKIERLAGTPPCKLFRPHAGWRSSSLIVGAARAGYKVVGWSWMTWDWVYFRKRTGPRVAHHVLAHAAPGKVVVIHDGHHKNPRADRAYAVEATRLIVDDLQARGLEFKTLCESEANLAGDVDVSHAAR